MPGDVIGMGADLFAQLGTRVARMPASALREVVAREARAVCERELRMTIEKMARTPTWLALSAKKRVQAVRIAYDELQREHLDRSNGLFRVLMVSHCPADFRHTTRERCA